MNPSDVTPELDAAVIALDALRAKVAKDPVSPSNVGVQAGPEILELLRSMIKVAARADRVALFLAARVDLTAQEREALEELWQLDYDYNGRAGKQG